MRLSILSHSAAPVSQDMSIAGKRAGLDGERSSLFYQAIRIIKEMREKSNGKYPRWAVWENVQGAMSSNSGEDFRCVLEAFCKIKDEGYSVPRPDKWQSAGEIVGDGFSLAWRVLDAQYWGVPQRRKRIFLVADFADKCAGKVLFESEGVSGYSPQGFRSWQRAAGNPTESTGTASICLNDQGCGSPVATSAKQKHRPSRQASPGSRMDVTEDVTATLRAEAHHPPAIMESAGFCTEHSAKARSIGYEKETAPTLRAGTVPAAVALENHPTDSRVKISEDGKVQTLTSRMGTGGNNVPLLMKIRSGCEGGGKGALWQEDKSATLACNNDQTLFVPEGCNWDGSQTAPTLTSHNAGGSQRMPDKQHFNCVLQPFGISSFESNAMKSDNPHSGIYETETSRTLDCNGGNPANHQGGVCIVEKQPIYSIQGSMIGRDDKNGPQGNGVNEDISFTLNTTDRHAVYAMTTGSYMEVVKEQAPTLMARDYKDPTAVTYGIGRDAFNQGRNARFSASVAEELQPTLVAKGPGAVAKPEPNYTVRRLTPTECARLQGFPDWWCDDLTTDDPTEEELAFWKDVFETHRSVVSPNTKPKSESQIRKWLKNPHSDSAEYKMWGNGLCVNVAYFVLSGIVWVEGLDEPIQPETDGNIV